MTEWLHFHFSLSCIGEGNGNPLHCSCLENPRELLQYSCLGNPMVRGAWWVIVHGVKKVRHTLATNPLPLRPLNEKKDSDARKDWKQNEKEAEEEVDNITDSMAMNLSQLWEIGEDRGAWCATVHGVTKSQTLLSDWTTSSTFLVKVKKICLLKPKELFGQPNKCQVLI